jgi:hypothetical protein
MRSDFLAGDLVGFTERVAETLLARRLAAFGAGAETSSRASIMVISGLIFQDLSGEFQVRQKQTGTQKPSISQKNGFFVKIEAPLLIGERRLSCYHR